MAKENEFEGFIDVGGDTEDIHEPQPVPTGVYDLTVLSAKGVQAEDEQSGQTFVKSIQVQMEFDGLPNAATLFHNVPMPKHGEKQSNPKGYNFKIVLAKKFYKLAGVPVGANGFNTTDLIGARISGAQVDLVPRKKKDGSLGEGEQNQLNLTAVKV